MTYEQIIQDLKNKIYKPIYFLMGEESYFIDKITDYIQDNVLNESEKTFNQTIFYGKDSDIENIISTAKRFPMMSNHQVVIVKEAQNLKKLDDLKYYAEQPLNSTILVINYKYGTFDKRKAVTKAISKMGVLFQSDRLYENKIPKWITDYLKAKGYSIEPHASVLLTEFLGNDLGKIVNELDKLTITLPSGSKNISRNDIEKNIGISKEYNILELSNALSERNVSKCYRIIHHFAKNPKEYNITKSIAFLYLHFSRIMKYHFIKDKSKNNVAATLGINPFFVDSYSKAARIFNPSKLVKIIGALREYDLKSKGFGNTSATDGDLYKELVYKILH